MSGERKIRKILLKILSVVFSVIVLAVAAVALILAKPKKDEVNSVPSRQPLSPSPALEISAETDLVRLISSFPAPVMNFMSGSGMTFVSATSSDTAVSGSFGRIASIYWQTPEGEPMILQTIYPSDALSLLEGGYHFTPYAGPTLFGNSSVRMEKDDTLRFHTATDQALYVLTITASLRGQVSSLCRSLQLFTVNNQD